MNVINAYLDTMFSPYPTTPKMLEAKTELQAMMEDAYQGLISKGVSHNEAVGKVITDFGNLDELAPVLGITAELHPTQSESEPATAAAPAKYAPITLDEAQAFAHTRRATQVQLAVSVALFVLAPIPLFLSLIIGQGHANAAAFGLIPLLVMVAIGVVMVVGVDQRRARYKHISEYRFSPNPAVTAWARDLELQHERRRIIGLQIAVTLWILSAAPLVLTALLLPDLGGEDLGVLFGVACTLAVVATGLLVFLPTNWASEVAATVTRQHGAIKIDALSEEEGSFFGVIAAVYWPLLTVIYLGWSFIGNAWGISWLVWPIGAVFFGMLAAGFGAYGNYRKAKQ